MVRIKWGGSLTSFIVTGAVLVLAVGGISYAAQARGNQARNDRAASIAAKQAKLASDEQKAADKANTSQALATTTPTTSNSSVAPQTEASTTSTVTTDSTGSTVATTSELPTTGITFSIGKYIGLGLLVAVALSYVRSRRKLVHLL